MHFSLSFWLHCPMDEGTVCFPKICSSWHLQGATISIGANVSVSLCSLPLVIKHALTKWFWGVRVKFCHFSEPSKKIRSLSTRSRVCFHSFQSCRNVGPCHHSAECTIIHRVFIIMLGSTGSFYTLFMLQLCLGKVHFPLLGFWR